MRYLVISINTFEKDLWIDIKTNGKEDRWMEQRIIDMYKEDPIDFGKNLTEEPYYPYFDFIVICEDGGIEVIRE